MTKVSIKRLDSITKNDTTATEQINSNFLALQEAIENTLSRDGTGPNFMDADLDMNSYRIINSADPVEDLDIVNKKYVEEKIGVATEASKTAVNAAAQAATSAQSALVSSTNAINTLRNAENTINQATALLTDTKAYVDATKVDIDSTVAQAKADVNSAIDEATMDISNIVSDAEGSITNIAVTEANKAIANAAQEATDMATANLNSYVDGTVKPSLKTYVDQAQEDANSAATSMEQAALSATAASNYASNASADADNAAESATSAANSARTANGYAQDAATSANLANIQNKITNCITEIPQDIKLELKDGTLTLKAGSKVYVPNGVGKFDEVVISADKTRTWTFNGQGMMFYRKQVNALQPIPAVSIYSGGTAPTPTINQCAWYDTSNNKIKISNDKGATWEDDVALPLCLLTANGTQITSIDQVFNGFGYIGSTIFALPGVKGLIPDGRNADGSLKNIEFTVNSVRTLTANSALYTAFCFRDDGTISFHSAYKAVKSYSDIGTDINWCLYYVEDENNTYYYTTSAGSKLQKECFVGFSYQDKSSPFSFTSFAPKLPFRAVDYNDVKNLGATITYWDE